MKTLQNNFTTPEQSKKLLELGVPANSADCIWYNPYYDGDRPELSEISVWKGKYPQRVDKYTFPCWSVGRLMEIYELCYAQEFIRNVGVCLMEDVLSAIYDAINNTTVQWDFSKLE